jgi:SRSO17 transposase
MDLEDEQAWQTSFSSFMARFSQFFKRAESRDNAARYVRGLLTDIKRKTCWQLAETMGESHPDGLQRLLYRREWDADAVCQALRKTVIETMGYEPGIGVIDESGFVKKGQYSAGVKRQYCGRVGKIENCQVGVYLGYIAPHGHALLDRELYVPEDWCADAERRAKAKIPAHVTFQTKPQLAWQMLQRAWADGVPLQWVVGDSAYGNAATLREAIAAAGHYYALEMPKSARIRTSTGVVETVEAFGEALPPEAWTRSALTLSEQGLRESDWTAHRVVSMTDDLGEQWLLIRHSLVDPTDFTYCLSNAPADTPLDVLVQVAGSRYHVEHLLEEAKGVAGLGQYEVRYWHSWYRHMTLALMAHAWLTLIRHADAQKKSRPAPLLAALQLG